MLHRHVFFEAAAADTDEGHPVAVPGVHVGLKLEHEAAEPFTQRVHQTFAAGSGDRPLRHLKEGVEERTDPEVGHGRAEEHRGELTGMDHLDVQLGASRLQELHFFNGQIQQVLFHQLAQGRVVQREALLTGLLAAFSTAEQNHLLAAAIDHTSELLATADRPVHRPGGEAEFRLDFIEQGERFPPWAVHLVDEGEDRDLPHAADLEQLPGLRLQALGGILQHHGVVRRCQSSVGVFGKILVTWRVQEVDRGGVVIELQHRGGD